MPNPNRRPSQMTNGRPQNRQGTRSFFAYNKSVFCNMNSNRTAKVLSTATQKTWSKARKHYDTSSGPKKPQGRAVALCYKSLCQMMGEEFDDLYYGHS